MDYLEMMRQQPRHKEALVINGKSYTYKELVSLAEEFGRTLPQTDKKKIYIIREKTILRQLVSFIGCMVTGWIPLIVPYDSKDSIAQLVKSIEIPQKAIMAVATSGSTGVPKILFRSYESWAGFFDEQNKIFGITEKSRLFAQGSLAFTGNLNLYMAQFYAGATMVAEDEFAPQQWAERIVSENVNAIYLIPVKLLLLPRVINKSCGQVETILAGSQSLGRQDAQSLKTVFPNVRIVLYYGASELNYITYVTDEVMTGKRNLIGRPFPGVSVEIIDGEIIVDTPWHVEGIAMPFSLKDMGYMDESGNFYFEGRNDDIVNIRGRKVSLLKIQNRLEQLDEVQEASVVYNGKNDTGIEALVVLKEPAAGMDGRRLSEKLRENLAHFEMPRKIVIVDEIPKNESGKIIKNNRQIQK